MAYSSKTVEGGNREYVPFAVRQHPLSEPPPHAPCPRHPSPHPAAACCLQAIKAFRAKLEAKRFPIGPSIGIKDPVVTDGIADEVDYIWYDQEHSTMVRPPLRQPTAAHRQPYPLLLAEPRPAAEPHLRRARPRRAGHRPRARPQRRLPRLARSDAALGGERRSP